MPTAKFYSKALKHRLPHLHCRDNTFKSTRSYFCREAGTVFGTEEMLLLATHLDSTQAVPSPLPLIR